MLTLNLTHKDIDDYISESFVIDNITESKILAREIGTKSAFQLECEAIRYVREIIGLSNVIVMLPFCKTIEECKKTIDIMREFGLERGINGLKIYLMC